MSFYSCKLCITSNTYWYRVICQFFFQLHTVSRTQQGRQWEPSVNTLRSPLSAEALRILEALRVESQNSTPRFASTPERRNGNINFKYIFHLLEWGSNPQPVDFTVTFRAAAPRLASGYLLVLLFYNFKTNRPIINV